MKHAHRALAVALAVATVATLAPVAAVAKDPQHAAAVAAASMRYTGTAPTNFVDRGRYVVRTAGCNDCHTANYPEAAGNVPEREWLTGMPVGFQGPWGTTYPANLRLSLAAMTEAQWLVRARQPMRPPMPWFSLRDMSDDDLRAVYAYVRSLGPAGKIGRAHV